MKRKNRGRIGYEERGGKVRGNGGKYAKRGVPAFAEDASRAS
jgi:hypothetical protein